MFRLIFDTSVNKLCSAMARWLCVLFLIVVGYGSCDSGSGVEEKGMREIPIRYCVIFIYF